MGDDGQSRFNEKAGRPVKFYCHLMDWGEGGKTPLLEQEGWPKAGVVVRSKWFSIIPMNE